MTKFKLTRENIRLQQSELKLIHPVHGETDAIVYLVGEMSRQFNTAKRKVINKLGRDIDFETLSDEQQVKALAEVYVKCVVGWNDELAEAIGEYSEETALTLFLRDDIEWIGAQIAAFANNATNFFRNEPADLGQVGSASNV